MNSYIIYIILLSIIIYLYYNPIISSCITNKQKINPKDFNPAIHHPAAL
uniref:Uncharacterized protein n=1 Tax=viral metagenome TaxID=1070528 RepID=A0A6C0I6Q7_9ZZZZ